MNDEKFEQFLTKAAQSYNAPPARVPRNEMWEAIEAARSTGPRVVYGGVSHLRSENRLGVKVWWAAAAALLLVASGIGIGRWSASSDAPPAIAARPSSPATALPSDPIRDDTLRSPGSDAAPPAPSGLEGGSRIGQGTRVATIDDRRTVPSRVASAAATPDRPTTLERTPATGRTAPRSAPTSAYQLAEVDHLTQAEALLTSFRTRSSADQQQDARLAAWARELLSNTRLLLDSPVAEDPQRRPLLQDLELLLVQIVQLSPGSTPQDREIVEKTLQQDQLMTKLRTAIPAGQRGS